MILWDDVAKTALKTIIEYITYDSPQNAELVRNKLLKTIAKIPKHPEKYPADKYRNQGNLN